MVASPVVRGTREDGGVLSSAETCVVCRRARTSGSFSRDRRLFVCAECEADADQFLAIQDALWPGTGVAADSSGSAATPTPP